MQTVAEIGRGLADGSLDAVDLTEAALDAIAAHPHQARIFTTLTPDRARAEAAAARARAKTGSRRGPLDGVPLSWKDLIDSAGTPTEGGTRLLKGRTPATDAPILARATGAGAVCLGTTHLTEFAFSGLGLNPSTATAPNVHGDGLAPGGSSSGAAASVAFGLAPAAIGSDTGGSIRLPAAWNDLVGVKPTYGALPTDGVLPLCQSFDTLGPLTRTIEDAALILAALGGPRADLKGATLAGTRIGRLRTLAEDDMEPAPAAALDAALDRLARAGAEVVDLHLPDLPRAVELGGPLYTAEAWRNWRDVIARDPGAVFPPVLQRIGAGQGVTAADYLAARDELDALRARAWAAMGGLDAIACATSPIRPPLVAPLLTDHEAFRVTNLAALRNTRIANLLGLCSLTLPTGHQACGLMLSARPGRDGALLRLAAAAERVLT